MTAKAVIRSGGLRVRGVFVSLVALATLLAPTRGHASGCKVAIIADLPVTIEQGPRASVPVRINDHPTSFWLDSGAFFSIMSRAKAAELELSLKALPVGFELSGIGGNAGAQFTTIRSFGLLKHDLTNVDFIVGGSDAGNGLIGANILGFRDAEFDLAHGSVKLADATDCKGANLAYWAQGKQYFVAQLLDDKSGLHTAFALPITINGVKITAELDTGATNSLLSRHAAELAKIDLKGPGSVAIHGIGGFGRKTINGWSVPVADVGIGDEHVLSARLDVIDGPIVSSDLAPDMLLGADFALAHHIYVARRTHMVFFTYSGGKPFVASEPAPRSAKSGASPAASAAIPTGMRAVDAVSTAVEPTTADGFARRGSAQLAQRAFAGAIADFTEAIRLAPDNAQYYRARAEAYSESEQIALARRDIDKAIALDPNQGRLLIARAEMRLVEEDRVGALADAEAAAKVTPASSLEMADVANLFAHLSKPERAAALIGPVLATHSEDSQFGSLLNARCWFRALGNIDLDKGLDDCNRAIRRFGAGAAVLDSRGLVQYRRGDMAAAIADYDAALKLNDKKAWSLFMRGAAKAKRGDVAGGKADQAAARAIDAKIDQNAARYGLP